MYYQNNQPGAAPGSAPPGAPGQYHMGQPPMGQAPPPSGYQQGVPGGQPPGAMGGPPMGGPPMGGPPMGGPPMGGPPMGGPPTGGPPMGGPPTGGPPMGGPPTGGPPMGGPPMGGPPMGGGPPTGGPPMGGGPPTGGPPMGGPPMGGGPPTGGPPMGVPGPPASAQFYSMTGGAPQPVQTQQGPPSNTSGMPPPPTGQGPPGSGMPPQPGYAGQQYGQSGILATPQEGNPLPSLEEMDLSIQCDPKFMRTSVSRIVNTQRAANDAKVPLGVVVSPMAGDRCRTYINPFVAWTDGGRRWRCNMCGMLNDVPSSYFSQLDSNGRRRDQAKRPELSRCSVEFVAPGDYMVRPPQPPVYLICIDVSAVSVANGMLSTACDAIKEGLSELAKYPRTQVGFITFDSSIHFYNLKSNLSAPQMMVVSDISEIIVPHITDDLLVSLEESRAVIETLLDSIPTMFTNSQTTATCTGPALQAAKRVISHLGGKIMLFQSSLPSYGEGALKQRENPRMMGTEKEHLMLAAENQWYMDNAIDFSRLQICVDVYLFSGQYTDVATIGVLPKVTGGTCYYYPAYHTMRDAQKFHKEVVHNLTRPTGFESVMRVRATRGIRISNFYGNHYIRGQDLLALPNCTSDSTFTLDFTYDEPVLTASAITVQAALLYTSMAGERRIRVHTMLIPVTQSTPEMLDSLDIDVAVNIMSKQAIDIAQKSGIEVARRRVHENTTDIIRNAKTELPQTLSFLPLYSMSLMKNVVMRGGSDIRLDERAFFQLLVQNMTVEQSIVFIYPRMFSIHDMDDLMAGPFNTRLPGTCNLTSENLTSDGIFLLETGSDLFMWIGSGSNPLIIQSLFGVTSLQGVDMSTLQLQTDNDDFSARFYAIVTALRADRQDRFMLLHKIREGDGYAEAFFGRFLVEDRANFHGGTHTYAEYHALVNNNQQ
eukprot:GSChrysophyteH1.ASY1.ANO1.1499.1 assembled CDS